MHRALAAVRHGAALAAAAGGAWVAFGPATAIVLGWDLLVGWLGGRSVRR